MHEDDEGDGRFLELSREEELREQSITYDCIFVKLTKVSSSQSRQVLNTAEETFIE